MYIGLIQTIKLQSDGLDKIMAQLCHCNDRSNVNLVILERLSKQFRNFTCNILKHATKELFNIKDRYACLISIGQFDLSFQN